MSDELDLSQVPDSEFELTERELIIAQGGDPDSEEYQNEEASEDIEESNISEDSGEIEGSTEAETQEETQVDDGDWITEEVIEIADAYGIDDDEIVGFDDENAFYNAVTMIKKRLPDEGEEEEHIEEEGDGNEFLEKVESLREAGYEDDVLDLFREQYEMTSKEREANKHLTDEIASIQQNRQEEALAGQAMEFHNLVDNLDEDRYGRSFVNGQYVDLSKEHDGHREKLWDAMDTITSGIHRKAERDGVEPQYPSNNELAHEAELLAFADSIREEEQKNISQRIQQQSRKRRPVGSSSRRQAPTKSVSNEAEDIANDPRLVEFWEKAHR